MTAHSPGEWTWELRDYGEVVVVTTSWHEAGQLVRDFVARIEVPRNAQGELLTTDVFHANIRVMLAAPKLLAALQDALEYLQHHLPEEALASHRAAIAAATGAQ